MFINEKHNSTVYNKKIYKLIKDIVGYDFMHKLEYRPDNCNNSRNIMTHKIQELILRLSSENANEIRETKEGNANHKLHFSLPITFVVRNARFYRVE
jgi:hypothetical protein